MMRFATLLLAAIALASPAMAPAALADEPQVVVLRGASAPPAAWYEPPPEPKTPEPKIIVQQVYVPLYYTLPVATGPVFFHRPHFAPSARRNR